MENPNPTKTVRLLIVEDDLVSSYAMSMMLQDHGLIAVDNIMSADQIMNDFEKHHPDAVLMDIRLNGSIDGIEAAEILREKYDVPIVFISAFNDEETKSRIDGIEGASLITKPYEISQIVRAVRNSI